MERKSNEIKEKEPFLLYNEVYELYLNLYPSLKRFPNSEKFTLRQNIDNTALEMLLVLDKFIRIKQKDRITQVKRISHLFDKFKLLLRISTDLQFLPTNQYILLVEKSELIGKLIGGLLKKYKTLL